MRSARLKQSAAPGPASRNLEARYANHVAVGHSPAEFILSFGQQFEPHNEPVMHTKIVTAPAYAKAILKTLNLAVVEFEASYGRIPEPERFTH
jgi:hypothetical protein